MSAWIEISEENGVWSYQLHAAEGSLPGDPLLRLQITSRLREELGLNLEDPLFKHGFVTGILPGTPEEITSQAVQGLIKITKEDISPENLELIHNAPWGVIGPRLARLRMCGGRSSKGVVLFEEYPGCYLFSADTSLFGEDDSIPNIGEQPVYWRRSQFVVVTLNRITPILSAASKGDALKYVEMIREGYVDACNKDLEIRWDEN